MNPLWPYKSSPGKRKHWFRKGKMELLVTIYRRKKTGKTKVKTEGNLRGNFSMMLGFTINNEEVIFE